MASDVFGVEDTVVLVPLEPAGDLLEFLDLLLDEVTFLEAYFVAEDVAVLLVLLALDGVGGVEELLGLVDLALPLGLQFGLFLLVRA